MTPPVGASLTSCLCDIAPLNTSLGWEGRGGGEGAPCRKHEATSSVRVLQRELVVGSGVFLLKLGFERKGYLWVLTLTVLNRDSSTP